MWYILCEDKTTASYTFRYFRSNLNNNINNINKEENKGI